MAVTKHFILAATFMFAMAACGQEATGQTVPCATRQQSDAAASLTTAAAAVPCASPALFDPTDSEAKFQLQSLMAVLRDSRHESWVLAAYPDPKTSRPLIGAGFSLSVEATEHPQSDPLNPHTFLEPSSAQLWEAAGLDPARLQAILDQYDRQLKAWKKKNYRRKIKTHQLPAQISDEDATKLLQISVVQAVHNARAYCREFDQLTASQQMALSQLVYQMGVNLEEFTQFLSTINDLSYHDVVQDGSNREAEVEHWKAVQTTLIQSDWARRYSTRAVAVIAMFNPDYDADPAKAERQVRAQVHPLPRHHKKAHAKPVQAGNENKTPQRDGGQ